METERLILRPLAAQDFDAWAAFMDDEEAARYIGGRTGRSDAWRGFMTMAGAWAIQGFSNFSVLDKAGGTWLGRIGPWYPDGWPGTEVGWGLARAAWGKGYATEAAAACLDYAFDVLGWDEVIHCIDPANAASQSVARRLGAINRGPGRLPAPFEASPIDIWGQDRDQWRARRAVTAVSQNRPRV